MLTIVMPEQIRARNMISSALYSATTKSTRKTIDPNGRLFKTIACDIYALASELTL
jgi:hypothetical protein